MSTRSTIKVKDEYNTFYIYRHHDGYPNGEYGVINTLEKVFPFAWPLPRFESGDFAAAIIAAWKGGGGGIYFTHNHNRHGDTVYEYDIYFDRELMITIREGYSGDKRQMFNGTYADALIQFK